MAWEHLGRFREALVEANERSLSVAVLLCEAASHLDERNADRARERLNLAMKHVGGARERSMIVPVVEHTARLLFVEDEAHDAARMPGIVTVLRGMLDEGDPAERAARLRRVRGGIPARRRTLP